MSVRVTPTCYVAMPFGTKRAPDGSAVDFDAVWTRAIEPTMRELGFDVRRADSLETRGVIHKAIYEAVLAADVMIADVSLGTPNVLYELGIRHAVRPSGTVVLSSDPPVPFDLGLVPVVMYRLADGVIDDDSVQELSRALSQAVASALEGRVDSPLHELFPELSVAPQATHTPRGPVDLLRQRLRDVQRLPGPDALDEIRSIEQVIIRDGITDHALLTDLMLAYRDAAAWEDTVRVIRTFPPDLQSEPSVVQQLALALNRTGDRGAAALELVGLIERGGGDSETFGLLGRVFKDEWAETADSQYLDRAIDAYRRGFELDRSDYYPGINLATLLAIRGDAAARAELADLLPELRLSVDARVAAGQADYWEVATSLELAVIAGDYGAAAKFVEAALERAAAPWMTETTARNLELLASTGETGVDPELQSIIERLRSGVRIGDPP